jgi:hypothetical protein
VVGQRKQERRARHGQGARQNLRRLQQSEYAVENRNQDEAEQRFLINAGADIAD